MIYHKIISLLIVSSVALISGCADITAEKTNNANYPSQVALHAMGETFQNSASNLIITQQVNSGEFPDKAVVTIEASGMQDDSVSAEKTVFTMRHLDGKWQIVNRIKTQRCWPGRGHQEFSEQRCN